MSKPFSSDEFIPSFEVSGDMSVISKGKTAGLYVYRSVVNAAEIIAWAKSQGFQSVITPEELHVTVIYSKTPVDWFKLGQNWWNENKNGEIEIQPGGPRAVQALGDKGAVVLMFASNDLSFRNKSACDEYGCSWDYDEYQPHITISYNAGDLDLDDLEPYRGKIVLGPEIFEEIEDDWSATEFSVGIPISKSVDDQRLVFGWAYVVEENGQTVTDHSGDQWDEADMEKAFYGFAEEVGIAGDMHKTIGVGKLVECMVFTKEKQNALGIDLGKVGAWVGFRLDEESYAKVKSGECKMLSIGFTGTRTPIDA